MTECGYVSSRGVKCPAKSPDTFRLECESRRDGGYGWMSTWTCHRHAEILKLEYELEGWLVFLGEVKCPTCGGSGKVSELKDD